MKGKDIVDAIIDATNQSIVIELTNGQRLATSDFDWGQNAKGEQVIIIKAGRKIK